MIYLMHPFVDEEELEAMRKFFKYEKLKEFLHYMKSVVFSQLGWHDVTKFYDDLYGE